MLILIFAGINSSGMTTIISNQKETYQIDFGTKIKTKINKTNILTHHHLDHAKFLPDTYIFGETLLDNIEAYPIKHHDEKTFAYSIFSVNTFYLTDCKIEPIELIKKINWTKINNIIIELNHDGNLKKLFHEQNAKEHLSHLQTINFLTKIPNIETKNIFFTHISETNMNQNAIEETKLFFPNAIFLIEPTAIKIENNFITKISIKNLTI